MGLVRLPCFFYCVQRIEKYSTTSSKMIKKWNWWSFFQTLETGPQSLCSVPIGFCPKWIHFFLGFASCVKNVFLAFFPNKNVLFRGYIDSLSHTFFFGFSIPASFILGKRQFLIGSNFDGRWTPGSEVREIWLKYSYFPAQIPILVSVIQKIRSIFLAVDQEISKYFLLGVNQWVAHPSRFSFPTFASHEDVTQGPLDEREGVGCDTIHCLFAECLNRVFLI